MDSPSLASEALRALADLLDGGTSIVEPADLCGRLHCEAAAVSHVLVLMAQERPAWFEAILYPDGRIAGVTAVTAAGRRAVGLPVSLPRPGGVGRVGVRRVGAILSKALQAAMVLAAAAVGRSIVDRLIFDD